MEGRTDVYGEKGSCEADQCKNKIPWIGEAEWTADPKERSAAWSLYVELVTRIAVQALPSDEGSFREALTSLHSLFDSTRHILIQAGPDVGASNTSVGGIAIAVLNRGIRPFLTHWHPALSDGESRRGSQQSPVEYERKWPEREQFQTQLSKLRVDLGSYAEALAKIAGVTIQE